MLGAVSLYGHCLMGVRMLKLFLAVFIIITTSSMSYGQSDDVEAIQYSPDGKYKIASPSIFDDIFGRENRQQAFRHMDDYTKVFQLKAAAKPFSYNREIKPLPDTFLFNGKKVPLEGFLKDSETMGFLVIKDGSIVAERYYNGAKDTDNFTSWSMVKSFVSTLVGIALEEGKIKSLRDRADQYVSGLEGTAYGAVTIEQLLNMSSAVKYSEVYPDPEDSEYVPSDADVSFLSSIHPGGSLDKYVSEREAGDNSAGTKFVYRSIDTHVLSWIVRAATGVPVGEYLQQKLWTPLGMEGDAFWNVDDKDMPIGYCCMNVRVRDYAKLGSLFLNEGAFNGQQIISKEWTYKATTPNKQYLMPSDKGDKGYAYQWWVPKDFKAEGEFLAIGIWGQNIWVNRKHNTVIVRVATDPEFGNNSKIRTELYRALTYHYAK